MNPLIEEVEDDLVTAFEKVEAKVKLLGAAARSDLAHECEDLERADEWTARTAAHMVHSALLLTRGEN